MVVLCYLTNDIGAVSNKSFSLRIVFCRTDTSNLSHKGSSKSYLYVRVGRTKLVKQLPIVIFPCLQIQCFFTANMQVYIVGSYKQCHYIRIQTKAIGLPSLLKVMERIS